MPITFSFDGRNICVSSEFSRSKEPVILSCREAEALQIIESSVAASCHVERRTKNYLSVFAANGVDFCRLKFSTRSSWFSLELLFCSEEVKSDILLSSVPNKNQHFWKITVSAPSDLKPYSSIIAASYARANSVVLP